MNGNSTDAVDDEASFAAILERNARRMGMPEESYRREVTKIVKQHTNTVTAADFSIRAPTARMDERWREFAA